MIFINVFAFLYARANHKEIFEEMSVPFFFQKNAFLLRLKANCLEEMRGYLSFSFVDSNSPCKDLLLPQCPTLAQKLLYSE